MAAMPDWFVWTDSAQLGQAILVAREASGLSQGELGRRAGLNRKFIYRLESGRGSVNVDKTLRVLAALGLAPLLVHAEALAVLR
jgi:transcriptional regulator with XRE-family HTH domain